MAGVEMAQPDEGLKKSLTQIENAVRPKPKPGSRRRKLTPLGQGWKRGLYPPEMNMPQANITCMLYFDEAPKLDLVADEVEKHIWPRYRFSSLVVDMDFVEQDGPMDRAYHFQEKEMGSVKEIEDYTFNIATLPLDADHPLWRFEIVRNKTGDDIMILKIHHCLSDGLGILFAFLPMLNLASGGNVLDSIPLPAALKGAMKQKDPAEAPVEKMTSEERRLGCCRRRCRNNSQFWKGACSALTMGYDSDLKVNPPQNERKPFLPYSGRHVFTKMPATPTSLIKQVRAVHKCTFNDAIMAALSGAFRRYSIEKLDDPLLKGGQKDVEVKSFMLLALPRPVTDADPDAALVNNFLTPVFKLAVNETTPKARLEATVAACNELKSRSYVSGIWTTTKTLSALLPASVLTKAVSEAISKLTANITSVPLPDEAMTFQGKEVKGVQMIFVNNVPQVSILSYNGTLNWNMVTDPQLIAEPEELGRFFEEEMEALAKA